MAQENQAANVTPPQTGKLVIDGVEYAIDQLSDEAKAQIGNLQATEQELTRLKQQTAIVQTARMAYANALKKALPAAAGE
jgi:hypothetical protein